MTEVHPRRIGFVIEVCQAPLLEQVDAVIRELRLVLCGGDRCLQQTFQVSRENDGFAVEASEDLATTAGRPGALPDERALLYQPALSETLCRSVSATARPSLCEESLRGD